MDEAAKKILATNSLLPQVNSLLAYDIFFKRGLAVRGADWIHTRETTQITNKLTKPTLMISSLRRNRYQSFAAKS